MATAPPVVRFSYLWRDVVPGVEDAVLYNTLKTIYVRLQQDEDPGVLIPMTITNICLVLQEPTRALHVKCILCHVLNHLCFNESMAGLFIKRDLLVLLHALLEQWTTPACGALSPCELLLLNSQLALLETISHHHVVFVEDFVKLDFIKQLCHFCRPQCSATYGYGSESYAAFHTLTDGVYPGLIGKVSVVSEEVRTAEYAECFSGAESKQLTLPDLVLSVALYDTSGDVDKDIVEEMRFLKGTWPRMEDVVPDMMEMVVDTDADVVSWHDVYVTSIVDGCRFWAQLGGKESTRIVQTIDVHLAEMPYKFPLCRPPLVGTLLAMRDPVIGYYRGQVTAVHGELAEVHALDSGCRKTVSWRSGEVFEIVTEMKMDKFKPQAKLCLLKGVSPPPLRVSLLKSVAAILRNLTAEANQSFKAFSGLDMTHCLQYLVACPEPLVVLPAAQAISNMARSEILRIKLNAQHTLSVLMVKMEAFSCTIADYPVAKAMYFILGAIRNLLCKASEAQEMFYNYKGLEHMIQLMTSGAPKQVQMAAGRVVAMYVGNAIPVTVISNLHERRSFPIAPHVRTKVQRSMVALGMCASRINQLCQDETSVAPPGGTSTKQPVIGHTGALSPVMVTSGPESSDERQGVLSDEHFTERTESDAELLSSLVGKNRIGHPPGPAGAGDSLDSDILAALAVPFTKGANGVLGLNTAHVYKKFARNHAYIKGRQVNFKCDLHHDFRPNRNLSEILWLQMMKSLCGIINTGEDGSVFIGLSPEGVVNGVLVERATRDVLRVSIDTLLKKVKPGVPSQVYNIYYHQVLTYDEERQQGTPIQDVMVIEIKLQPTDDVIHTLPNGEIMMRRGNRTVEITMQDLHERTVLKVEESKLAEIETLEKELSIWTDTAK